MENPYKMTYHIEPSKGLLNDPNGLIQYKGTYYFFHQWNRFDTNHNYKEWGLFTSKDMIHWEENGSAIIPDRSEDRNGIYSGSGIEYNNKLYLFYTGNVKNQGVRKSYQCISISEDGRKFIKQNNFIETPSQFTEHHRDPKVWKGKNNWWMIVGAQLKDEKGAIALYSSDDLLNWKYENILYDENLDNMCECPDMFNIKESVDILICCPQIRKVEKDTLVDSSSYAGFMIGEFDEKSRRFLPKNNIELIDYGFDFYAPQSFLDDKGRRIIVGWMSRMSDEEEKLCPTNKMGYMHCLTLPRVMTWENNKLIQRPIEEVKVLRKNKQEFNKSEDTFKLKNGKFEIEVLRNNGFNDFELYLINNTIEISYCLERKIFSFSRENWITKKKERKIKKIESLSKLRIFSDSSSIEIFINDGEAVFSSRYFIDEKQLEVCYIGLEQGEKINYYEF